MGDYTLNTPFEFLRRGKTGYAITRGAFCKFEAPEDLEESKLQEELSHRIANEFPGGQFAVDVAVEHVSGPQKDLLFQALGASGFEPVGEAYVLPSVNTQSALTINVVVDISGGIQPIGPFSSGAPIVYYCFDLLFRYRSSIYWPGSGRPCPRCVVELAREQCSPRRKNLLVTGDAFSTRESDRRPGVTIPDFFEVTACVGSALKLKRSLEDGDSLLIDELRAAEWIDLRTERRHVEVLPVDLRCTHDGFLV